MTNYITLESHEATVLFHEIGGAPLPVLKGQGVDFVLSLNTGVGVFPGHIVQLIKEIPRNDNFFDDGSVANQSDEFFGHF